MIGCGERRIRQLQTRLHSRRDCRTSILISNESWMPMVASAGAQYFDSDPMGELDCPDVGGSSSPTEVRLPCAEVDRV